jgi:hypothetical protein
VFDRISTLLRYVPVPVRETRWQIDFTPVLEAQRAGKLTPVQDFEEEEIDPEVEARIRARLQEAASG